MGSPREALQEPKQVIFIPKIPQNKPRDLWSDLTRLIQVNTTQRNNRGNDMFYIRTLENAPDDIVRDIDEVKLDPVPLLSFGIIVLSLFAAGLFLGSFIAYS